MPDASGRIKGIAVPRVPWHEATALAEWMLEPCDLTAEATRGAYTGHVPYLAWDDGPKHECLYCGARAPEAANAAS